MSNNEKIGFFKFTYLTFTKTSEYFQINIRNTLKISHQLLRIFSNIDEIVSQSTMKDKLKRN